MSKGSDYGAVLVQNLPTYAEAEAAVSSLAGAGMPMNSISVVLPEVAEPPMAMGRGGAAPDKPVREQRAFRYMANGPETQLAGVGTVIGGPLAELLAPANAELPGGNLCRALRELGVEQVEATFYRKRLAAGDVLVVAAAAQVEPPSIDVLNR